MALKSIKIRKWGIEDPNEVIHIQGIINGKKIAPEGTSYGPAHVRDHSSLSLVALEGSGDRLDHR